MSCIHCNFEGECNMLDKDHLIDGLGCDEEGYCLCEDDLEPSQCCDWYESGDCDDEDE